MPRKDGFPTNPEMLADFTEIGRQIFVESFKAETEAGLHPAYAGKPLSMLTLDIITFYSPESKTALSSENLHLTPLQEEHVVVLEESERPPATDIIELRRQQATNIGALLLSPSLRIEHALPTSHVVAYYTAENVDKRVRSVHTFTERPAKIVISSALTYAEDYLGRIRHDDILEDMPNTLLQAINRQSEYNKRVIAMDTWAQFDFVISPELPLNGHESTGFLRRYHSQMRERLISCQNRLERMNETNAPRMPVFFKEYFESKIPGYADAKGRAKKILEDRGEQI